jgi:hypothetical protein
VVLVVALEAVVVLVAGLDRPPWGDEAHFLAAVRRFGTDMGLDTLRHYRELSPPLPFALYAWWGRLWGFETPTLRVLSLLIALATYTACHRLLFQLVRDPRAAVAGTMFVALHPYMVGLSLFVFTDMLGVLFVVLCILSVVTARTGALSLAVAGALLTRQYLAFVALAAGLYALARTGEVGIRRTLTSLMALGAATTPLIALMLLWGGPVPDSPIRGHYLSRGLAFHGNSVTLYVAQLGVYLLPLLVWRWRHFYGNGRVLGVSAVLALAYWWFPLRPSPFQVAGGGTVGFFHKLVRSTAGRLGTGAEDVVFFLCVGLGLPVLLTFLRDLWTRFRRSECGPVLFLDLTILSFFVVMPWSYMHWEKYFLPLLPVVTAQVLAVWWEERRSRPGAG